MSFIPSPVGFRLLALGACVIAPATASAVVLHNDDTGSLGGPDANVVGQWRGASAVAIAPRFFLASHHQAPDGQVGSSATFGGSSFDVVNVTRIGEDTDLQLLEVDSELPGFAPINTAVTEPTSRVTIAGYGQVRGSTLLYSTENGLDVAYAYSWADNPLGQVRGENRIEGTTLLEEYGRVTESYYADFDEPGDVAGDTLTNEADVAVGDSGGGWFTFDPETDRWLTTGITLATTYSGQSIFREPLSGIDVGNVQSMPVAANLSAYASQINQVIPEPTTLGLLGVGALVLGGRRRRGC